jgi:hypothetical protein
MLESRIRDQALSYIPNLVQDMDNDELTKQVTREDILEALMQFKPDKAPSPNGFTSHFYKICWYIIKFELVRMT